MVHPARAAPLRDVRALLLILKEVVRALLGVGRIQRLVQELLLSALIASEAA